jgi:hypothetical protein
MVESVGTNAAADIPFLTAVRILQLRRCTTGIDCKAAGRFSITLRVCRFMAEGMPEQRGLSDRPCQGF